MQQNELIWSRVYKFSLILDDLKAAKESSNDIVKRGRTYFERHRFLIRLELETIPYIGGIRNDEKNP